MAIDYSITAKEIVKELGGDENIVNVTHRKESRSCEPDHRCHFQHFCPIFIHIGGMWYLAGDS